MSPDIIKYSLGGKITPGWEPVTYRRRINSIAWGRCFLEDGIYRGTNLGMSKSCLGNGKILLVRMGSARIECWSSWRKELSSVHRVLFGGILKKNASSREAVSMKSRAACWWNRVTKWAPWGMGGAPRWAGWLPSRLRWLPSKPASERLWETSLRPHCESHEHSACPARWRSSLNELLAGLTWAGGSKKLTDRVKIFQFVGLMHIQLSP